MKKCNSYFLKQKIMGCILVLLGIISAIVLDGDITVAILMVPFGLCVIFTKEKVLHDYHYEDDEDEES